MPAANLEYTANPLRCAIIGYGLAGSVFHAPLIAATPGMTVAAIVTNHAERQAQARRDFPRATILPVPDDIWDHPSHYDLVVVAAPNRTHLSLGLAAMAAGLPVVIDKPMAATVADAERLIATSKRTGKLLSVFQNRRWDNDFLTVRQMIALDMLGQVTRFESRFERYRPVPRANAWRELPNPEEAGGLLYDLGSHLIDQALLLFGTPVHVYAEMETRRPGVQVDDDTFVALQFASGANAHLWMSVTARVSGPRLRLSGLRGTYEKWGLDPQEEMLRAGLRPGDPTWSVEPREHWGHLSSEIGGLHIDGAVESLPGSYERFYTLLRDALLTNGPPPVNPGDVVTTLRVIEAAQQSVSNSTVVEL
ncbi:MAG: Gfo/Idh/MocA family oxidoreductase [Chloroflexota bacterium]|nr:Gfo/Idh/MocA family oxidoreductase [Chloroflexota bacterium]